MHGIKMPVNLRAVIYAFVTKSVEAVLANSVSPLDDVFHLVWDALPQQREGCRNRVDREEKITRVAWG